MTRNISDKFELHIIMYEDFEVNTPIWRPMQGRLDTDFVIALSKDGELVNVDPPCSITAKFFCYERINPTILADTYTISPYNEDGSINTNYNITIADNHITIPANIAMTDFSGIIKMTLIVNCTMNGVSISIPYYYDYEVMPMAGYKKAGGNINLLPYANVDLTNVSNSVFKDKADKSGVTGGGGTITNIDGGTA